MSDIVEFLRARLHEDERLALNVLDTDDAWWVTRLHLSQDLDPVQTHREDSDLTALARHFDRARMLREIAAKRQMLAWAEAMAPEMAVSLLELLALPYSEHPDYRQEWSP